MDATSLRLYNQNNRAFVAQILIKALQLRSNGWCPYSTWLHVAGPSTMVDAIILSKKVSSKFCSF